MTDIGTDGEPQATPGPSRKFYLALLLVLFALAVVVRLPQFLSRQMVVDGDEAIVGLMAKHLMEGKQVSLLFYGQRYGFTLLESGTAALSFALFGVSCAALKGAMLVLWLIGAGFFMFAMRRFHGEAAALFTGAFLLFTPSWAAWSMKARGGYVTAFLLLGLALWLISVLKKEKSGSGPAPRPAAFFGLGIIYGFLFISQPLFFLAGLTFLPLAAAGKNWAKKLFWLTLGGGLVLAPFYFLVPRGPDMGEAPTLITSWIPRFDPKWILGSLVAMFKGSFVYQGSEDLGIMTLAAGYLGVILMFAGILLAVWAHRRRRPYDVALAASLGIFLVLAITLVAEHDLFAYRYLLAIPALSAVLAGSVIQDFFHGKPVRRAAVIAIVAACGLVNAAADDEFRLFTFYGKVRDPAVSERNVFNHLLAEFEGRQVHSVYSLDELLQWIITFESRERIAGRWMSRIDRSSAYIERVDRDLVAGRPVAVVGRFDQRRLLLTWAANHPAAAKKYREVAGRYAILFSPPRSLVEELGFLITEFH